MKMKSAKLMTLMTAVALGVFSGGNVMAAGNGDFYMQPPADSGWQKANTEGAYASYTNGSDYINVYKYSVDDVKAEIARCDDKYEACYQTIYSEGNSLYMAVGYAKDISEVRKLIEDISYPGNPSSARQESDAVTYGSTSKNASDSQSAGATSSSSDADGSDSDGASSSEENADVLSTATLTLFDSDGNSVSVDRIIYTNYDSEYVGDETVYTTDDEIYFTDQNGKTWQALNDDTHYMGAELEQHTLTDADGNSVTVTQTTNGDYYFRDDNGTGFTDNGDGTWSDENGNNYTEN